MKRRTTMMVMIFLTAALAVALMPGASAKVTPDNCVETEYGTWCSETVLSSNKKFDGLAIGDADNDGKDDIVGVGLAGNVWIASKKSGEWQTEKIWESDGELIIPAVGDADNDGDNEIVVVGMVAGPESDTGAGHATLIEKSGNDWSATRMFTNIKMLHAVDIGDFDPGHTGNEVVVGGFAWNMTKLTGSGSNWDAELMFTATHKVRTVLIRDVDGDNTNEVVAASKDKNVYVVGKDGGEWTNTSIYYDEDGGTARIGVGDYDGDGKPEVAAGGDSGNVGLADRSGSQWTQETIFEDVDKHRGIWIEDVYDGRDGPEIITAGYSTDIVVHFEDGGEWKHVVVFDDEDRFHHGIAGDVDPDHPGNEIVCGGYSKKVTVVAQYHPDFSLNMKPTYKKVVAETEAEYKVTLASKDFYTDDIDMKAEGLPDGATVEFSSDPATLSSEKVVVTMTVSVPASVANGNHTITVKGTGQEKTRSKDVHLEVDRTIEPGVTGPTEGEKVKKGDSVTYEFTVENKGNLEDTFSLEASSSAGMTVDLSTQETQALQPGESVNVTVTLTVPKDTKEKSDVLTVKAISKFDGNTSDTATIETTVKKEEEESPGFGGALLLSAFVLLALLGLAAKRRRE